MITDTNKKFLPVLLLLVTTLISCNKEFKDDCFTAYFGGEVTNQNVPYVLFLKDDKVIDTIKIGKDNRFFIKFDSLTPGLYSFKHEPEYQYVYFDKNDSLMVRINPSDFDESIVFCGRGDAKNNFLMELYLQNEKDKKKLFEVFDYDTKDFQKNIDSSYSSRLAFFNKNKAELKWTEDFNDYAEASMNFYHYSKKEIYPIAHKMRTGISLSDSLPKGFYDFRKKIDFNKESYTNFIPFVKYLTHFLNNVSSSYKLPLSNAAEESLAINIHKLNIADTLFKNIKIKNKIIDNIAFSYLLEDQNIVNNKKFLERYHQLSSDSSKQNEIIKIGNAIQNLTKGNSLPKLHLIDNQGNVVSSETILKGKSVVFFWTENFESHLSSVHKKAINFKKNHPDYEFIAINIDDNQEAWQKNLVNYNFGTIKEYRIMNFDSLREKWVITKLHRTIILDKNGAIDNAFVNLFDVQFEKNLK